MKKINIYKNPFVSRKSYFIPVAPRKTGKMEAKATRGYIIEEFEGNWTVRSGSYYNTSLKSEMPVVGNIDKQEIEKCVAQLVISKIKNGEEK